MEDHSSSGGLNGRRKSVKKEKGPKRRRSSAAPSAKRRKSLAAAENVASKDTKTDSGKRKKDQVTIKAEPTESTDLVGSNTTVDKPDDANVAAAETPNIDEGPIASKPDSESAEWASDDFQRTLAGPNSFFTFDYVRTSISTKKSTKMPV